MNLLRSPARRARLAALLLLAAPLAPAAPANDGPALPHDDVKNRWFHWETAPIAPFAISPDGLRLYTVNQPGERIVVFDLATREVLREIPVGPGVVSIAFRPGTTELWAVDSITSSLAVIDTRLNTIGRSIRVGAGPHGIAFTPNGDRAFVSCSTANRVDVVQTQDYVVLQSIAIPAREPRGIVCTGNAVRVVAFRSGNGTAPRGNPTSGWTDDVVEVRRVQEIAGAEPLPDRDLFHIVVGAVPGADALDPSRTVQGLGTTLYDLHARPGSSELWIPHTDALQRGFRGERNFPAGQVVRNRVAIVGPSATSFLDLDALTATPERRCATPTSVAFTSNGSRAFVTGYASDTIAVLDLSGGSPLLDGLLRVTPARNYPDGAGPRAAIVTPGDAWLVISNKGDNTLSWFDLATSRRPRIRPRLAPVVELGRDPTPSTSSRVDHFMYAELAPGASCDSCHVDGHTDGLAWDLSSFLDPEGTPRGQLHLPLDRKGPLVTQSVRGMREIGPYHWRGERHRLVDFNAVFTDLLERHEDGELADLGGKMVYIGQYMDFLAPRSNPGQAADRNYTAEELAGANVFVNKPVLGALRCVDCHPLPLGTSGEMTVKPRRVLARHEGPIAAERRGQAHARLPGRRELRGSDRARRRPRPRGQLELAARRPPRQVAAAAVREDLPARLARGSLALDVPPRPRLRSRACCGLAGDGERPERRLVPDERARAPARAGAGRQLRDRLLLRSKALERDVRLLHRPLRSPRRRFHQHRRRCRTS
jgi:YVTN family beta-propeller protein